MTCRAILTNDELAKKLNAKHEAKKLKPMVEALQQEVKELTKGIYDTKVELNDLQKQRSEACQHLNELLISYVLAVRDAN